MRNTLIAASLALATFTGAAAMAQTNPAESHNKAIIQQSFDAWSAGTGGPFDLLAPDATWTMVGRSAAAGTYADKAAFMGQVIGPFNARMKAGIRPTIRSIHADGDTVIVFFDASGAARDGQTYKNTYAWFMTLSGGKVVEVSAFFDSIAFNDLWSRVPATGNQ